MAPAPMEVRVARTDGSRFGSEKSFRLFWLLAFPPFFFLLPLRGMIIWLSCKAHTD